MAKNPNSGRIPKRKSNRKHDVPRPRQGYTLDPGQRRAATKSDNFSKRWAEMPKPRKPILPSFLFRPRPKSGLSPLPYPLPKKPGRSRK